MEGTGPIRVVLADDHPIVRDGLRLLLDAQPDFAVVGEAADGESALGAALELEPDVIVVDVSMPGLSGIEAVRRIRRERPAVKVLALTFHEERVYLTEMLDAGAAGYVLKRAAPAELVEAVRTVATGGNYVDPNLTGTLLDAFRHRDPQSAATAQSLSEREREVLARIAQGYTNREIAAEFGISVKTVETYKARFGEKLGLFSRVEIVRYAAAQGWLT